ncbi:23136_t:CDS:2 [Entrophospora sp. SA101]|nr:23136_t:CDS:2 [Entrophospora sp. SA101]
MRVGFKITVEKPTQRIFDDEEYERIGCTLVQSGTWKAAPSDVYIIGRRVAAFGYHAGFAGAVVVSLILKLILHICNRNGSAQTESSIEFSEFLKRLKSSLTNQRIIVNISSLLAIKPTPNWGLYCMAKSARDTYLAVISLEEASNNTKTLNYAPGPLNNDMQKQVRETIGDVEQKTLYTNFFNNNQLLDMNDSSQKLVNLLFKNNFKSGSHIDYYDI